MATIRSLRGFTPTFGDNCFIAENATVVGDFICGNDCSFWFNAVIRADVNSVRLGNKVNIQDGAIIHCTYKKSETILGNNVSVGHNAIVHGCIVHDNVLIGMNAVVMDNAVIHSNTIVAAGAVVLENAILESNSIYAGVPAKKIKTIPAEQSDFFITRTANNYVKYAAWYQDSEE